jgi:hypothetical protein
MFMLWLHASAVLVFCCCWLRAYAVLAIFNFLPFTGAVLAVYLCWIPSAIVHDLSQHLTGNSRALRCTGFALALHWLFLGAVLAIYMLWFFCW